MLEMQLRPPRILFAGLSFASPLRSWKHPDRIPLLSTSYSHLHPSFALLPVVSQQSPFFPRPSACTPVPSPFCYFEELHSPAGLQMLNCSRLSQLLSRVNHSPSVCCHHYFLLPSTADTLPVSSPGLLGLCRLGCVTG